MLCLRPASGVGPHRDPGHSPLRGRGPRGSTSRTPGRARLRLVRRGTRTATGPRPACAPALGCRCAARPTRISVRRLGLSMSASLRVDRGYAPADRSRRMRLSAVRRVRPPLRASRRGCRARRAWRQRSAARNRSWWSMCASSFQMACIALPPAPDVHGQCAGEWRRPTPSAGPACQAATVRPVPAQRYGGQTCRRPTEGHARRRVGGR